MPKEMKAVETRLERLEATLHRLLSHLERTSGATVSGASVGGASVCAAAPATHPIYDEVANYAHLFLR